MKNKMLVMICIVLVVIGGVFFMKKNKKKDDNSANLNLNITETVDCRKNQTFYFDVNDSNYYLVCLDGVEITLDGKKYDLKDAILDGKTSIDEITKELKDIIAYNNGEAMMYRDASLDLNNVLNLSILKCDTEKGNKDYYIGNREMPYRDTYCKRVCSFTRTYYISKIVDKEDGKAILTLREPDGKKYVDVEIEKIGVKFSLNSYYEFTFERGEKDTLAEDSTVALFKTFKLVNIERTTNTGATQKQEAVCKIK